MEPTRTPRSSTVTSGSGDSAVTLSVLEYGDRSAAVHAVLIHGFPDDQHVWDRVIENLPDDWHVVTYDVRGAGESSHPTEVAAYRIEHLTEDFISVLQASVPDGAAVHVGAHDWGSIAFWDVLARESDDPRLHGRIASYTSASGPSLDHLGTVWATLRGKRRLMPQMLHSWYVFMFQLPKLPEMSWQRSQPMLRKMLGRLDPTVGELPWGETLANNARESINLYRANMVQTMFRPKAWRTNVPVRLVIAKRDGFVTPRALEGLQARCRSLSRVDIDDGHWHLRTQPAFFAAQLVEQVN